MRQLLGEWFGGSAGETLAAVLLVAALAACVLLGGRLSVIDLREHRLPDRLTGPLAAVVFPCTIAAGLIAGAVGNTGRTLACAAIGGAGFLAVHLISPATLGFGDVKLVPSLAALTGFVSWGHALLSFVLAVLLAGLAGIVVMIVRRNRRAQLAFGPALVLGTLAALAW